MLLMNKCDKRTQVQLLLELHHSTALIWSVCFNPTFLSPATTYIIGTQISSNLEPGGRHRANGQDPGRAVRKNHLKKYQMCVLPPGREYFNASESSFDNYIADVSIYP